MPKASRQVRPRRPDRRKPLPAEPRALPSHASGAEIFTLTQETSRLRHMIFEAQENINQLIQAGEQRQAAIQDIDQIIQYTHQSVAANQYRRSVIRYMDQLIPTDTTAGERLAFQA
ncbi:hypothetical protein F66182_3326 [Fusarium sp. NRRL 66182]|nr:hypothetical protein F66182_3326 [Fusarium sp. NRRL 66182]